MKFKIGNKEDTKLVWKGERLKLYRFVNGKWVEEPKSAFGRLQKILETPFTPEKEEHKGV